VPERVDTVVIGAGQAGLATSYYLTARGREHVVLERGERVAHTWRTQRWDGFFLNTPRWTQALPGHEYGGPEPEGFSSLAETIAYIDDYAEAIRAPVRTGAEVTRLRVHTGGLRLELDDAAIDAANVVVATGAYQRATPTSLTRDLPDDVFQLHTTEYRRPSQLPDGAVLVVGSGQSGCQIADELLQAGRTVHISAGRCPWIPRRYRGREIVHWLVETGLTDQTVDTLPSPAARLGCNPPVSGNDGGHDCHPLWLEERGAILLGRLRAVRGRDLELAPDLAETLAYGDDFLADLLRRVDEYIAANGLDMPAAPPAEPRAPQTAPIERLDLQDAAIGTVLWANGFRPDYAWIDLPLFDEHGWPVHERGVTAVPGLYFVGMHWLYKRKSSLLFGVGEDAEYIARRIAGEPGD
jgi:putative flavoprotein involved in K+ transport